MTTAAEQYRALVQRLESIQEAPEDPRSPEERDSQMAAVKGAYQDYQDAEAKSAQPAASTPPAAQPSPVSGDVKKIQTLLNAKGANLTVDGKLGANTLAAIVKHLETEASTPAQAAQPGRPPQLQDPGGDGRKDGCGFGESEAASDARFRVQRHAPLRIHRGPRC